jgi:hypothetical protein
MKKAPVVAQLASGLGWPEGPAPLPDGRILFVESYRSQVFGGGPNAVLAAPDGYLYVTQNGGKIGPWRAAQQRPPSIQRIAPDGKVEILATRVENHQLLAPNGMAGSISPIPAAPMTRSASRMSASSARSSRTARGYCWRNCRRSFRTASASMRMAAWSGSSPIRAR